jgi:hypothetical protein
MLLNVFQIVNQTLRAKDNIKLAVYHGAPMGYLVGGVSRAFSPYKQPLLKIVPMSVKRCVLLIRFWDVHFYLLNLI